MGNWGYREIFKWDGPNLKQLNDTLRALWTKVMGGIDMKDLDEVTRKVINNKVEAEAFDELGVVVAQHSTQITQTAGQIQTVAESVAEMEGEVIANSSAITQTSNRLDAVVESIANVGTRMRIPDGEIVIDDLAYYIVSKTYEEAGVAVDDELVFEAYVTSDKAKSLRAFATMLGGGMNTVYGDPVTLAAYVRTKISVRFTALSRTRLQLGFEDGGTTADVAANIEYSGAVLRDGSNGDYVTKSEFEMTTGLIRQEVSEKLDSSDPASAVDNKAGVLINSKGVLISAQSDNGTGYLHVTDEGVSASSLTAPNVAPRYAGPADIYVSSNATQTQLDSGAYVRGLQDAVSRINGSWLGQQVRIHMPGGYESFGDLYIRGLHGSHGIVLQCDSESGRFTHYGSMIISNCSVPVEILRGTITSASDYLPAMSVEGAMVFLSRSQLLAGNFVGLIANQGANVRMASCVISGANDAAQVLIGAMASFYDVTGKGRLYCYQGMMTAGGKVPSGGAQWDDTFVPNNADDLVADSTGGSGGSVSTTTAEYGMAGSDSYAGGWNYFTDNAPKQGYVTGGGRVMGCIWFDNTTIRSALSGKSIKQATLRLHQLGNYGRGVGVSVQLWGTGKAYSSSLSGAPALTKSYGTIGSTEPGQDCELTLPASVMTDLIGGTINGLVLYSDDTAVYKDRDYSRNYTSYSIEESRKPRLTVVYG